MLRYIIRPLLAMGLWGALPQYIVAKPNKPIIGPTTGYIGLDIARTFLGWYQKTGGVYAIHGSIDCSPILWDGDYGWGHIRRDGRPQGSFASASGRYFSVGLGYNFLAPTLQHNQFFIGLRYARSFFDFQLESDKLQCSHPPDKSCAQVCVAPVALRNSTGAAIAHWWEVVVGGKVCLVGLLAMGCTVRYKFSKKIENKLYVLPFDIPGFGLAEFDHAFGYGLYILLRVPLQTSTRILLKKSERKPV